MSDGRPLRTQEMTKHQTRIKGLTAILCVFALLWLDGCSKSGEHHSEAVPRSPSEAASQLQKVFETATPETKQAANIVAVAMQKDDYEKAVVSLQIIRNGKNITLDQGLAIHNSELAMRRKILSGMEAGDENAKRAFQLLKELKRD